MKYIEAHPIAVNILRQLEPVTDFCSIAGSIRREKQEVKDIEIVATPKMVIDRDMFQEITGSHISKSFVDIVRSLGVVIKGQPEGRMMQIQLPQGIMLDLFMPQPHDLARQYAIRTGSADWSHKVLAAAWVKKGWVGTVDGLRLEKECFYKQNPNVGSTNKRVYFCNVKNPTLPPVWADEWELFSWLGLTWITPQKRYV